jgi:hypothetical protein
MTNITESDLEEIPHSRQESDIRYPEIEVQLIGINGNAFNVLGVVQKELKRHGVDAEEVKLFLDEAMSGDYTHLLGTVMNWVTIY